MLTCPQFVMQRATSNTTTWTDPLPSRLSPSNRETGTNQPQNACKSLMVLRQRVQPIIAGRAGGVLRFTWCTILLRAAAGNRTHGRPLQSAPLRPPGQGRGSRRNQTPKSAEPQHCTRKVCSASGAPPISSAELGGAPVPPQGGKEINDNPMSAGAGPHDATRY